jgi:hypothetical protein
MSTPEKYLLAFYSTASPPSKVKVMLDSNEHKEKKADEKEQSPELLKKTAVLKSH